jgi:branched-chain amino acid transport system permease protein
MVGTLTRAVAFVAAAAVFALAPVYAGDFQIALLTQGISWALLGLSVWILLRVCNLPSFGHAAFYGVGAYAAGLAVTRWQIDNIFVALAISVGISCAVALPIAVVVSRLTSVSFLLVTLAFAEMLHSLAGRWKTVGGSDGLVGVIRPAPGPLRADIFMPDNYFWFSLAVLLVVVAIVWAVVRSPFGGVLAGIRESEQRMASLGYNAYAYRILAFLLSAAVAGVGGLLTAYLTAFVDPNDVGALVSARGLLIAVIAGGSVVGPVVVAIALTELEYLLSSHTTRWLGVLGVVYVVVALLMPEHGWFAWTRRLRRPRNKAAQRAVVAEDGA